MILRQKRHNGLHMSSTFNFSPTAYAPPPSYSWMTMEEFRANCLLGLIPETTIRKSAQSARTCIESNQEDRRQRQQTRTEKQIRADNSNLGFIQAKTATRKILRKLWTKYLVITDTVTCSVSAMLHTSIAPVSQLSCLALGKMDLGHSTRECTSKRQVMEATSVFAYAIENILKSSVS